MNRKAVKAVAWNALKYALGLSVLVYVVWSNWSGENGNRLSHVLEGRAEIGFVVLALALGLLSQLLTSLRWYTLTRAQDLSLSLWNAVRYGALGYFLGGVLPGSAGGDLSRAILVARGQERRATAVTTVLADGAIALWTLMLLVAGVSTVAALVGDSPLTETRLFIVAGVVAGAVGLLGFVALAALRDKHIEWLGSRLVRFPTLQKTLSEVGSAARQYRNRGGMVARAAAFSMLSQIASVISFYLAAQVFPAAIEQTGIPSLAQHFVIVPIGMLIQFGFPAPGGVGGGEYAYGVLYSLVLGSDEGMAVGVLAALVSRAVALGLGIAGYLMFLFTESDQVRRATPVVLHADLRVGRQAS